MTWARRVEARRTQTTLLDSLKETKEFDTIKPQKTGPKDQKKNKSTDHPSKNADTAVSATHLDSVQPMGRCVGGCGKMSYLSSFSG